MCPILIPYLKKGVIENKTVEGIDLESVLFVVLLWK